MIRRHCGAVLCGMLVLLGSLIAGCSLFSSSYDADSFAASHMQAAEAFERAGDLSNATRQYAFVVSTFPHFEDYPKAVWRAATLYLNEKNPSADDSSAVSMLTLFLNLPVTEDQLSDARTRLALIERIVTVKSSLARNERSLDSLSQIVKKQTTTLAAQTQHLTELETEVRQTKDELTRLKEVDVQLSRLHRRR